jgi:hypothetical protein
MLRAAATPSRSSCGLSGLADELRSEVTHEWRDVERGKSWELPGLVAMLDAAKRREFDVLLIYDH